MKLKRFVCENVRGYMNFDIAFNDDLNFLIGINGSGKTTILKLLSGLLTPSFVDLCKIEYTNIRLSCENLFDGTIFNISSSKVDNKIVVEYEDGDTKIKSEPIDVMPIAALNEAGEVLNSEKFFRLINEFEEFDVVKTIKELKTPLFLGLNRKTDENISYQSERDFFYRREKRSSGLFYDTVDEALTYIQKIVFDNIRLNAKKQIQYSDYFREKVIQESFKIHQDSINKPTNFNDELNLLPQKKEKLINAIAELHITGITEQLEQFFNNLSDILGTLSKERPSKGAYTSGYERALFTWIVNIAQIEKIDTIIKYGNEYVEKITKLKDPIIRFTESVNLFFKEGSKELLVDGQGLIKVKITRNGKTKINSIHELSSGEKQIIIMLAHLSFCGNNGKNSVFIIDEPELSLHISWQEIFVDALQKASPGTQYILATHAPTIISKIERRNKCIDLTQL